VSDVASGSPDRLEELRRNLAAVRSRIDAARAAAGRDQPVGLVVVTKTFPADDVRMLAQLGVTDVGENRDQEAKATRGEVAAALRWHMIGQLQRKKAGSVARWADVVESVDRPELAAALSRSAEASGRVLEILLQVNHDPQPSPGRGGVPPTELPALAATVATLPALELRGLMAVAPHPGDPDEAFARLERLSLELRDRWPAADRISAGMSGDLEEAIAHGATQVRIGGAVLGSRAVV
jgi:pyridoxal phosphate enzyme (YggS family)